MIFDQILFICENGYAGRVEICDCTGLSFDVQTTLKLDQGNVCPRMVFE